MATPYAIIAQIVFGRYVRTMKIPETRLKHALEHDWIVLIRDSEMPCGGETVSTRSLLSNPRRYWDVGEDDRD